MNDGMPPTDERRDLVVGAEPELRLPLITKVTYALGDHTVNLVLSSTSFFYLIFLTDYAGLRPVLAGLVVWVARAVDALSDPAMGRISDVTRWKAGRRRPYFLIGALPFGLFYALMWSGAPAGGQASVFAYYASIYVLLSLSMTVLSVPYLALIPEMATSYDERTSVNTFRAGAAVLGTLAAVGMKPLADALGGDAAAWAQAGTIVGCALVVPWLPVHRVSFERREIRSETQVSFSAGARIVARQSSYRILVGLYLLSRISMDLIGAMFLLYFKIYLGREEDFAPTLALFLGISVLSLPFWLRVARRHDKRTIFIVGSSWWILAQLFMYAAQPGWPRWIFFCVAGGAAIGYAVCDLMPWSMLGEVIDEDELTTGERREGIFVGFFTLLRKLGGATGVALAGAALDLSGYDGGILPSAQLPSVIQTVRLLTSLGPAVFLTIAVAIATRYTLNRSVHANMVAQLERRRASG